MSILLIALSFFAHGSDIQPLSYAAPNGIYDMVDRRCLSGAPVRDGFQIGRDFSEVHFNEDGSYESLMSVRGCVVQASGTFYTDENSLIILGSGARDCRGYVWGPQRISVPFKNINDQLIIYSSTGRNPGPCPYADTLESTFNLRK